MRVVAAVLAGTALLVACSNDSPPQGESSPLVSRPTELTQPTQPSSPTPTPSPTPTTAPTASIAATLCSRVDQNAVTRVLKARRLVMNTAVVPDFGVPTYDVCSFTVTPASGRPYALRIGAAVLPAAPGELAVARRAYDVTQPRTGRARAAAVGQGGFGTNGFVVFLGTGRLVRVGGAPTFAQNLALARETAKQTAGLPAPPPEITRPECGRGDTAAAKVIGAPPTIRRDRVNSTGDTECGWAISTRTVSTTVARVGNAAARFAADRGKPGAEPVPLGDEGLYDARSHAVRIRIGTDKVASFIPVPAGQAAKNDVIAFALRLQGLYTR